MEINCALPDTSTAQSMTEENIQQFQNQQNRFLFQSHQNHVFQCIQFIHPPQIDILNFSSEVFSDSSINYVTTNYIQQTSDKTNCRFLVMREKESIKMFNVVLNDSSSSNIFINLFKKNQQFKLVKTLEPQATFVKKFIWWQYDPVRSLLYYMTILKENLNETTMPSDIISKNTLCNVRCISLAEKKPNQIFECPIPVTFPSSMFSRGITPNVDSNRMPWRMGPSSPDLNVSFQVVRMESVSILRNGF